MTRKSGPNPDSKSSGSTRKDAKSPGNLSPKSASEMAKREPTWVDDVAEDESDVLAGLTPEQASRAKAVASKRLARKSGPNIEMTLTEGNNLNVSYDHENNKAAILLTMADLATADPSFANGLVSQIAALGVKGQKADARASNFVLSVIRGVDPRNEVETMLAAQMGAIHAATMDMARRLGNVETLPQQDSAVGALNKLARTFATQVEALKRFRDGGQQKVTVEHVNVAAGGQAIVGTVMHGGGGGARNDR